MAIQLVAAAASQLINAQNTAALNIALSTTPGASQPFAITVWINANWGSSAASTGRTSMVGFYGPAPNPSTALQIGSTNGSGELSCWTWGGAVVIGTGPDFMTPYNGQWVHIGYSYDGTNHWLHLNGVLVMTTTTPQLAGNLQMVTINGYPNGAAAETWNHTVDSYTLHNRAISTPEVLTIYNAGGGRHGIDYGLIAGYEFDEGIEGSSVSTVYDLTGSALHLLMTGTGTPPKYTYATTFAGSNIRPVITT